MKAQRLPILLGLILAIALPAMAKLRPRPALPVVASLDGQFLVASRKLTDPNFQKTVVFIIAHDTDGAMGLVVNRAFGRITLKDLLGEHGIPGTELTRITLYYGGPVGFERGFVLHSDDYRGKGTQLFRNGLAVSADLELVRALVAGKGPKRSRFLAGYAGWGAGQLEHELARGDWLIAPADPELIFATDPDSVWEKALSRSGIAM